MGHPASSCQPMLPGLLHSLVPAQHQLCLKHPGPDNENIQKPHTKGQDSPRPLCLIQAMLLGHPALLAAAKHTAPGMKLMSPLHMLAAQ